MMHCTGPQKKSHTKAEMSEMMDISELATSPSCTQRSLLRLLFLVSAPLTLPSFVDRLRQFATGCGCCSSELR